ncbi:uncharacterized protein [Haliotis cracherodii]|uniref:uncharacterized protein n=1 Tax=Haliotis cracherodii TaxID=6455 RepID=UPI0039ED85B4
MATLYTILWIIAGTLMTATAGTRHGTRYTVYTLDKKQSEARVFCEEKGDHLLSFQSEEKLNRFLEISKPWLSKQLLTNSFWVSLKKDSSSFLWHDRTEYKDDYSNLTMKVNQSEKQCFVFSQDGNGFDLIEKDCFDKTYQVICERDLGLCSFEVFSDTKYRSNVNIMKTDVGKHEMGTCQRRCLDHSVRGEECIGVERDGNGACELLIGDDVSPNTVPTSAEAGTTLSIKRCYEEHFGGNPSQATMFTLYSFKMTWDQTRAFCEYTKQRMIQLDSPTKLSAFNNFHKQWVDRELLFSSIWIGLRDTNTSGLGAYNWTDEQPISTVTRWGFKEPRQSDTEQCIFLRKKNRRWKSAVCSRRYQVACEHSTAECSFNETTMAPVETPSKTTTGGTEMECQQECRTQAWEGFECSLYIYDDGTRMCSLYSGTLTLAETTDQAKKKTCFFEDTVSHENVGYRYSFYDVEFNKQDADTFCFLVGEEPLDLTDNARYNSFVQVLKQQTELPIHDDIWVELGTSETTSCNVITTGATLNSTTKNCNGLAQPVCFTDKFDCVFRIYKDVTIPGEDFLHLPGLDSSLCREICSRLKSSSKICVGLEHDRGTDCRLVMRQQLLTPSSLDAVSRSGNELHVVECNFGSFLNQTTTAKTFSVHGIRLSRDAAAEFCTQIGSQPLQPYSITELLAIFDILHHWQHLNFFADLDHVWTNVDRVMMGRVVSHLMSFDDTEGDSCVALNHIKATWTPYTCEAVGYVVCQTIDGKCNMEDFPLKSLADRSNSLEVTAATAGACQAWCMALAASFKECVAAEFDTPSCTVFFSDSVYVTDLPQMTASMTATVFIRRCFSVLTPKKVELTAYNFTMFDTPMTHGQAIAACRREGLEMIKLDNESSSALSMVYDRSKTSWLGLEQMPIPQGAATWTDGSQVSWTNWAQQGLPVPGQCVVLNSTALNFRWTMDNCSNNNYALCGNSKGVCQYDYYPGQKLPNTMIHISSITETKCKASCTDVLYNNTVCRGVSIDDGRCLLDMGQDIYYSIPALVNAVSYDTYIRVCHRVKELPYIQQKTTLSSSLAEENSSNLEPITHSLLMGQPADTGIVVTGSSVVAGASVVTGSSVVAGASVVTGLSVVTGSSVIAGATVVTGSSEVAGAGASVKTVSPGPTDATTNTVNGGNSSNRFWINENGRIVRSVCVCRCRVQLPETRLLMSEKIKVLQEDLIVMRSNVSSYRRSKTSAVNKKATVVVVGSGLGISIFAMMFVTLLILDFTNVCRMISRNMHTHSRVSQR